MPIQRTPADRVEDSIEALLVERGRRASPIYVGLVTMAFAVAGLLPIVRVGVSVRAHGIVRPIAEKYQVLARVSGFVGEVLVRNDESVARGEMLLRMNTAALDARSALLATRMSRHREKIADLERLAGARSPADVPLDDLRTARYRQEAVQLREEMTSLRVEEDRAARGATRARLLASRELMARSEVEERTFSLAAARSRSALAAEKYRARWQADLAAAREELRELESERAEMRQERRRYDVRAPSSGTVQQLASLSPGSYVQVGDALMTISPATRLVVESSVNPRDIGLVRVGGRVTVLVDAFDHSDWGSITGRVTQISDDYQVVDGRPAFRVVVALDRVYLQLPNGVRGELRKGMTADLRFVVADRSLLQLLRDDVDDWLDPPTAG